MSKIISVQGDDEAKKYLDDLKNRASRLNAVSHLLNEIEAAKVRIINAEGQIKTLKKNLKENPNKKDSINKDIKDQMDKIIKAKKEISDKKNTVKPLLAENKKDQIKDFNKDELILIEKLKQAGAKHLKAKLDKVVQSQKKAKETAAATVSPTPVSAPTPTPTVAVQQVAPSQPASRAATQRKPLPSTPPTRSLPPRSHDEGTLAVLKEHLAAIHKKGKEFFERTDPGMPIEKIRDKYAPANREMRALANFMLDYAEFQKNPSIQKWITIYDKYLSEKSREQINFRDIKVLPQNQSVLQAMREELNPQQATVQPAQPQQPISVQADQQEASKKPLPTPPPRKPSVSVGTAAQKPEQSKPAQPSVEAPKSSTHGSAALMLQIFAEHPPKASSPAEHTKPAAVGAKKPDIFQEIKNPENIDAIKQRIIGDPTMLNGKSSDEHASTLLISVLVLAEKATDAEKKASYIDFAMFLIQRQDIDLNLQDAKGNTALHRAAWYGFDKIAQALLEKGADPRIINGEQENVIVNIFDGGMASEKKGELVGLCNEKIKKIELEEKEKEIEISTSHPSGFGL